VAWVGVTEIEARAAGVKYSEGVFPLAASGVGCSGYRRASSSRTGVRRLGAKEACIECLDGNHDEPAETP
jgi:pyruvate/2-oxoglutarate dehydrogenase complex dihydrolipoamide dehydrogenase (E3) component